MKNKILLCGNPNVGKSSIFNILTSSHEHTGNWTGKTVSLVQKKIKNSNYTLVDLPGIYSLSSLSEEENITKNVLLFDDYDKIVYVADACNLDRNLNLLMQILEINKNVILCINMVDELSKKDISIDFNELEKILGIPVVATSCKNKHSLTKLIALLDNYYESNFEFKYSECIENKISKLLDILPLPFNERFIAIKLLEGDRNIVDEIYSRYEINILDVNIRNFLRNNKCSSFNDEISIKINSVSKNIYSRVAKDTYIKNIKLFDKLFSSRIYAVPILIFILFLIFYLTIVFSNYPSDLLSYLFFKIESLLLKSATTLGISKIIYEPLIYGIFRIIAFVVSVMLPPLIIFFTLYCFAEESGVLPRIAFNFDKIFNKCNCHGKQSLTMCTGFGCNACAVSSSRIIDSTRDRIIAILTNSFIPCNGRFPLIIALISMFFVNSNNKLLISFYVSVFVLIGILISLVVSFILSKTILKGVPGFFVLELPEYKKVNIIKLFKNSIIYKTFSIVKKAVIVSIPSGLIIWLLTNININDISIFSYLSYMLNPFARIIGMDGVIILSFILGLPANEIVLPIVLMGYLNNTNVSVINDYLTIKNILILNGWTLITAVNVILFSIMHFPCATTLLTIKKEIGTKWMIYSFFIPLITGITFLLIFNLIIKFVFHII